MPPSEVQRDHAPLWAMPPLWPRGDGGGGGGGGGGGKVAPLLTQYLRNV